MVVTASLARYGNRKQGESAIVDKEINGVWPVTDRLQKILKWPTITKST
jgi:hypothetical protein